MTTVSNPFGTQISTEDIIETLSFFDSWEDRYKYIIDLGKELPQMDKAKKNEKHIVRGCQSQVWIDSQYKDEMIFFEVDSDAFIVKGLLGIVLAAYNGKKPSEILEYDIEGYFENIGLIKHLSPTRGNGLRAMVKKIQAIASSIN